MDIQNTNLSSQNQGAAEQVPKRTSRSVNIPDKSALKLREKKAKRFLCVMLSLVVVFVAVVCVFVNNNNQEYIALHPESAQGNSDSTESALAAAATTNQNVVAATGTIEKADTTKATTEATTKATTKPTTETTTKPTTQPTTAAAPQGSFFNPVIVSDFSYSTVVVNRNYRLPAGYSPDRADVGNGQTMRTDAAEWYIKMYNAGRADGVELTPFSGYRSYETQTTLYNNKVAVMEGQGYVGDEAKIQAATIVMVPGSSEHNLGLAMDIVCCDNWFEDTAEYRWLVENAADYGFILRYPADKQDVTKVIYEPWHWRFVGVETAKAIKASGLVMEEYYGKSAQ